MLLDPSPFGLDQANTRNLHRNPMSHSLGVGGLELRHPSKALPIGACEYLSAIVVLSNYLRTAARCEFNHLYKVRVVFRL
jgi:hypothetical protein